MVVIDGELTTDVILAILKNGQYLIVAGERRFLAARQLGMWTIPAMILDGVAGKQHLMAFFHLTSQ